MSVILANVSLQPGGPKRAEATGRFRPPAGQLGPPGPRAHHFQRRPRASPKIYNDTLLRSANLLPLPLTKVTELPAAQPDSFDRKRRSARPSSPSSATDENYDGFNKVKVFKTVGIDDAEAGPATPKSRLPGLADAQTEDPVTVLLRYSNGKPAMVSKRAGAGKVIFVGTAMHPVWSNNGQIGWTDLPLRHGLVIPLLDVMLSHLLHSQTQNYNLRAGGDGSAGRPAGGPTPAGHSALIRAGRQSETAPGPADDRERAGPR